MAMFKITFVGRLFGDPHFVTLDGKNYTFNGCGWYTYFSGVIPGNNGIVSILKNVEGV